MHAYARVVHDNGCPLQYRNINVCYRFDICVTRRTRNTFRCRPSHVTRNAATCIRGGWITRNALTCQHVMPKRRRQKTGKQHVLVSVKNSSKSMQAKLPQPVLETPEIDYDYGIIRHFI